jgi:hypothetical protein
MNNDRTNCDDPLDNARRIEVTEISDMGMIPIQPLELHEYPGQVFYDATDVMLILTEFISPGKADQEYKENIKRIIDSTSIKIFEAKENAQWNQKDE